MNPTSTGMGPEETQAVLTGALHRVEGVDARLEGWVADERFTEYGKRRVVRYDLDARIAGVPQLRRYRWLGKFYERAEDAYRVATVLREMEGSNGRDRASLAVPSVLAFHAPRCFLLLTYEPGESVTSAIARDTDAILKAMGHAMANLHALPIAPSRTLAPDAIVADIRPRIRDLCGRFPSEADSLRGAFDSLERDTPPLPAPLSFVHGDFGPANLLWRNGHIVVLDFDKCARGDPAADLGNLFAQLFRMTIRKPDKLRDFATARSKVLESYRQRSRFDATLDPRVAWYERATLLRKIHRLAFSTNRPSDPASMRQREAEALRLIRWE
jgi:aminoglycoside phosphotransferase (APT) family kinase protein